MDGGNLFTPVCLSVCEQDISKSHECIGTKFGGELGYATWTKWLNFAEDSDPKPRIFKVILHHWVIGFKQYIAQYLRKLQTDSDETWWMSWFRDEDKPIKFISHPNPDLNYQWDTKLKLISLVEVCSLPSALLILNAFHLWIWVSVATNFLNQILRHF